MCVAITTKVLSLQLSDVKIERKCLHEDMLIINQSNVKGIIIFYFILNATHFPLCFIVIHPLIYKVEASAINHLLKLPPGKGHHRGRHSNSKVAALAGDDNN